MFRPEHHPVVHNKPAPRFGVGHKPRAHLNTKRKNRGGRSGRHDDEERGRRNQPEGAFMDEKQLERSLNLGVERIASLCHDGLDLYLAIHKAVDEVNAKADRDSNLAVVSGEQLAAWFDILAEGRHRKRRRRRLKKRGTRHGSALAIYTQKEEAKNHVEPPPRVANRGPEIREVMRRMLEGWRDVVREAQSQLRNESERLRAEMAMRSRTKTTSKDEERRYYLWVVYSAWKLYRLHRSRAEKRAARRAKFQGAIANALLSSKHQQSVTTLTRTMAYGQGMASLVASKIKLRTRGGAAAVSDGQGGGGAAAAIGGVSHLLRVVDDLRATAMLNRSHQARSTRLTARLLEAADDEDDDEDGTTLDTSFDGSTLRSADLTGSVSTLATTATAATRAREGRPPSRHVPAFLQLGKRGRDPALPVLPSAASAASLRAAATLTSFLPRVDPRFLLKLAATEEAALSDVHRGRALDHAVSHASFARTSVARLAKGIQPIWGQAPKPPKSPPRRPPGSPPPGSPRRPIRAATPEQHGATA